MKKIILGLLLLGMVGTAFSDTAHENETLARIAHTLDSLKSLINEAELQHEAQDRYAFDYTALRADIEKIKTGILRKFKQNLLEPRRVEPIHGDYLSLRAKG